MRSAEDLNHFRNSVPQCLAVVALDSHNGTVLASSRAKSAQHSWDIEALATAVPALFDDSGPAFCPDRSSNGLVGSAAGAPFEIVMRSRGLIHVFRREPASASVLLFICRAEAGLAPVLVATRLLPVGAS